MAVSLVSTGVQFPDSTIQTTAAGSPPGALSVGSTILGSNGGFYFLGYATSAANSNTANWTYLNGPIYSNGGAVNVNSGYYIPVYSSYYGGWINLLNINNSAAGGQQWICLSKDGGVNWAPIMRVVATTFGGYNPINLYNNKVPVAVDESNGRIWCLGYDSGTYQVKVLYQTTIGSQASTWTNLQTVFDGGAYSQLPTVNSFEYVNMGGVTANSGIVITGKSYGQGNQVKVIAAGGTTLTSRFSSGSPTSNNYGGSLVWNYAAQRAWTVTDFGSGTASVTSNVNQAWTSNQNLSIAPGSNRTGMMAMSSSYNAYSDSSTIYYNTGFTAPWTSSSPGLGTLVGLTHNGTYWLLRTSQGLFYSSSATPTGWTATGFLPAGGNTDSYPIAVRQY